MAIKTYKVKDGLVFRENITKIYRGGTIFSIDESLVKGKEHTIDEIKKEKEKKKAINKKVAKNRMMENAVNR